MNFLSLPPPSLPPSSVPLVFFLNSPQFFDRLKLFGMPAKHQPDFTYLRHVPLRKVHLFTLTQLTCLVLLWVIKTSPAAIVFPMMVSCDTLLCSFLSLFNSFQIKLFLFCLRRRQVLALVFVRKLLDLCFSKRELNYLDDLMPEWKKIKLDDASKKMEEVSPFYFSIM